MLPAYGLAIVCLLLAGVWFAGRTVYEGQLKLRRRVMGVRSWKGFLFDPGLFYHSGHTWVKPMKNGAVRVGVDDFGRRLMGGVSRVELPGKGEAVRAGEAAVHVKCGLKHVDIVSPVDGRIVAVNEALGREGRALDRDPYGKGWLFTARVSDRGYGRLATGRKAREWLEREVGRLSVFVHDELGATAADGGELVSRPSRVLNEAQWTSLVRTFFAPRSEARS